MPQTSKRQFNKGFIQRVQKECKDLILTHSRHTKQFKSENISRGIFKWKMTLHKMYSSITNIIDTQIREIRRHNHTPYRTHKHFAQSVYGCKVIGALTYVHWISQLVWLQKIAVHHVPAFWLCKCHGTFIAFCFSFTYCFTVSFVGICFFVIT